MEAADHKKKAGQYRTLSRGYGSLKRRKAKTKVPPKLMSAWDGNRFKRKRVARPHRKRAKD